MVLPIAMVAGCGSSGSSQSKPRPAPEKPDPTAPRRQLESRDVTVAQRDERRVPQWTIKGDKALINVSENGKFSGTLEGVTGELYQDGRAASRFSAQRGEADQNRDTLSATGDVTITDTKTGTKLIAEHMKWLASRKLIEASGNVRVIGTDYEVGPMPRVLATPDLKKFGTPDRFPSPKS